jgi:hypothetical protein
MCASSYQTNSSLLCDFTQRIQTARFDIHNTAHSSSAAPEFFSSANLAAIVGLPRVSFLIVTSCALPW